MKTVQAPIEKFVGDGSTLYKWLGSFWTRIYENPEFTRNLQYGQGLLSAQLYLNFLENLNIIDRKAVPVFHRERWKPVVIRRSSADTGDENLLRIGMDNAPVIGPQTGSNFVQDKVFNIGGNAIYEKAVSYPIDSGVKDIVTCVTDNILSPTIVLLRDRDFIARNNTIFFLRDKDPFIAGQFPVRTITNEDGTTDEEVLLWCCDVLIDRDLIYEHLGYVLGLKTESEEFYQRLLNALWDMYNEGTPISWFQSGVGAILGEQTIIHPQEVVETILNDDQQTHVITDKEVYTMPANVVLRNAVVVGATLACGEFLTETLRLYDTLNPMKLAAVSEYGERFRTDISSLFFSKDLLRAPLTYGIGAYWDLSNIVSAGVDSNGNQKLKFDLVGTDDDVNLFWQSFWNYLEEHNMSSETCFSDYIDDIVLPDGVLETTVVYGRVSPLEFFLRYFLKANAFILVIDRSRLVTAAKNIRPSAILDIVREIIPAHVLMFIVERFDAGPDELDLGVNASASFDPMWAMKLSDAISVGGPSISRMTFKVRKPRYKWVPACD